MGWGLAGGVLGIVLMFGAWKWLTSYAGAHSGGTYIPTIGSRPRRLAGVPEEAPADAKAPPGMEVLRYGEAPVVVPETPAATSAADDPPATPAPAAAPIVAATAEPEVVEEVSVTVVEGAASGIVITEVHHGGEDQGEFVRIENTGPNPVALENWKLTDSGAKNEYTFTAVILEPGASIRVHMWRGEDTASDIYVGRRNNWWNNEGDTAHLYDAAGVLVYQHTVTVSSDH